MEWLLHRLEMALPQPVLHGKATEQVSGQSGRRDPGWVVVREVVVSGAHSLGSWSIKEGWLVEVTPKNVQRFRDLE